MKIQLDCLQIAEHLENAFNSVQVSLPRDESNSESRQSGSKIDVKLHKSPGQTVVQFAKEKPTICRLLKSSDVCRTRGNDCKYPFTSATS
jgi:hypothetical protein